jgi:hypothetical protein
MSRAFDWVVTCRLYIRWVLESTTGSQTKTPWTRKAKNNAFRYESESPLTPEQRTAFKDLQYFPENPALRIITTIEEHQTKPVVMMTTSTGSVQEYSKYGQFTFEVNGEAATLQVYQDPARNYFFLPFIDATAPDETYGAGRYLDIEPIGNGQFLIDFNYAYNPYCAYNEHWSCPIPPRENRLKVQIEAGEKKFHEG